MTALELLETIYAENENHIDFMENMGRGECDCHPCVTLQTMAKYLRNAGELPEEEGEE